MLDLAEAIGLTLAFVGGLLVVFVILCGLLGSISAAWQYVASFWRKPPWGES